MSPPSPLLFRTVAARTTGPRAALVAVVGLLSLYGISSWGTVTLLDHADTRSRVELEVGQAVGLLDEQTRAAIESGTIALAQFTAALEEPSTALALALGSRGPGEGGRFALVDSGGTALSGPSVLLDRQGRQTLRDLAAEAGSAGVATGTVLAGGTVDGRDAILLMRPLRAGQGRSTQGSPGGEAAAAALLVLPDDGVRALLATLGGEGRSAGLFRLDGSRLAGVGRVGESVFSLGPVTQPPPGGQLLLTDWRAQPPAGGAESEPAFLGLRRMENLPVLTAVAVSHDAVFAPWRQRLARGLAVSGIGLAALACLGWLGWRGLRREEDTRRALEEANLRLEQHVEERTADLRALNQKLVRTLAEKERADQAKTRFLSAANHDLRQPFQALRLFHHLLMERLTEPRDRTIAEKMGEALDSGENLLHALLEVATLDAGVVRPNIADVAIAEVLQDVVREFGPAAADKGLDLRLMVCDQIVRTDRTLLARMLRDLVRNAVAYTETGRIVLGCRRRGQWLRVEVWDTGPGIPAEHLDAIFEDFVQLGNPERDRRRGLGLGLAKVRRKAALLGHSVEVRSRYGLGSVFTISVPVAASDRPAVEPISVTGGGEAAGTRLILVVEDDPVQRGGMQMLLESWGHRVIVAADGAAALDCLRAAAEKPDLVVSDFRLPGPLSGVQVVMEAGALLGRPLPGLILTGDTAPERIREAVATGCRLLHKPVTPDLLREALAAVATAPPGRTLHRQTAA